MCRVVQQPDFINLPINFESLDHFIDLFDNFLEKEFFQALLSQFEHGPLKVS
jgi:hypothetical protein